MTTDLTTMADVLVVGAGPAGLTDRHHPGPPRRRRARSSSGTRHVTVPEGHRHQHPDHGAVPHLGDRGPDPRRRDAACGRSWPSPRRWPDRALAMVPFGYPTDDAALAVSPTTAVLLPAGPPRAGAARAPARAWAAGSGSATELAGLRLDDRRRDRAAARPGHRPHGRVRARYVVGADGPRSAVRIRARDRARRPRHARRVRLGDLPRRPHPSSAATPRARSTRSRSPGAEACSCPTSGDDRWIYAREWHPEPARRIADWTPSGTSS